MSQIRFTFKSSDRGLPPHVGYIPLLLGLMCLLSAAYYEVTFICAGKVATGQIDRFERPRSTTYVYVRYPHGEGSEATFRQTLLMRESFRVGQSVSLRYLPKQPSRGRIDTYFQLWQPLAVKLVLGLLSVAAAIALFRRKFFGLSAPK